LLPDRISAKKRLTESHAQRFALWKWQISKNAIVYDDDVYDCRVFIKLREVCHLSSPLNRATGSELVSFVAAGVCVGWRASCQNGVWISVNITENYDTRAAI
jgi:hypothetical protein